MKKSMFCVLMVLSFCISMTIRTATSANSGETYISPVASKGADRAIKTDDQSLHTPGLQLNGGTLVRYEESGLYVVHDLKLTDWDGVSADGTSHALIISYPDGVTQLTSTDLYSVDGASADYWVSDPVDAFEDIQAGEYTYRVVDSAGNTSVSVSDVLTPEQISIVDMETVPSRIPEHRRFFPGTLLPIIPDIIMFAYMI